jgi:hypothetical protein
MNCWPVLTGTEAASGDKVIDTKFAAAAVILRLALDCCVPDFAVMVTVPEADPVAIPEEVMLATLESDELHCAELVMSFELPSE